jgi:hypothetical protein
VHDRAESQQRPNVSKCHGLCLSLLLTHGFDGLQFASFIFFPYWQPQWQAGAAHNHMFFDILLHDTLEHSV